MPCRTALFLPTGWTCGAIVEVRRNSNYTPTPHRRYDDGQQAMSADKERHAEEERQPTARDVGRLGGLVVKKAGADDLVKKSAALAYITLISLVPLLAAFTYFGANAFSAQQGRVVALLSTVLPYSETAIFAKLQQFLDQAAALRGPGLVAFLLTSLAAFTNIEETINKIWNVPQKRPFRVRLLSFTLLIFWGPLLIGATYSGLFFLGRVSHLQDLATSIFAQVLPFAITILGLTMLYWLVPYTTVAFRSALAGGLVAAILLEVLRHGFSIYIGLLKNISLVYGSFGLVLFFVISVQITWWIVLLGSVVAYCFQNFAHMLRHRWPAVPLEGGWLALTALVMITERFRNGHPVMPRELLADRLQLATPELEALLDPLVKGKLLTVGSDENDEGYLLSFDPYQLPLREIFALYEDMNRGVLKPLPKVVQAPLRKLRDRLTAARDSELEDLTVAALLGAP